MKRAWLGPLVINDASDEGQRCWVGQGERQAILFCEDWRESVATASLREGFDYEPGDRYASWFTAKAWNPDGTQARHWESDWIPDEIAGEVVNLVLTNAPDDFELDELLNRLRMRQAL